MKKNKSLGVIPNLVVNVLFCLLDICIVVCLFSFGFSSSDPTIMALNIIMVCVVAIKLIFQLVLTILAKIYFDYDRLMKKFIKAANQGKKDEENEK